MNKNSWKMRCVDGGKSSWKVGEIIVVKDNKGMQGEDCVDGDFSSFNNWCEERKRFGSKWELIEDSFTKSDLQECDLVVLRDEERRVYFNNAFLSRYNANKLMEYYDDNLVRNDKTNEYDAMQVYRNGNLIFKREEQSPRDIKIKELQDKIDAIKREMEELK